MDFIKDLRDGERVEETYLLREAKTLVSKAGKEYMDLTLQDKTGSINAKIWDINSPSIANFQEGDFVEIIGDISTYNGSLQMKIVKLKVVKPENVNSEDFYPTSPYNIEEMLKQVDIFIERIKSPYIKSLMEYFFKDEDFRYKFSHHTAAKVVHHAFVGGLIHHSTSVARLCSYMAKNYPQVNADLLVAGALLHDVGKLYEIDTFPTVEYTDEGHLVGHIVKGYKIINDAMDKIEGFPEDLKVEMSHMILSHHGLLEYGSPVTPRLLEAIILSTADKLDADMEFAIEAFEKITPETNWTQARGKKDAVSYRKTKV